MSLVAMVVRLACEQSEELSMELRLGRYDKGYKSQGKLVRWFPGAHNMQHAFL